MSDKGIEFDGEVVEGNKGIFRVKVSDTHTATCTLGGRIRTNGIRILVGDIVRIEVSIYDTTKGRIIYRSKL